MLFQKFTFALILSLGFTIAWAEDLPNSTTNTTSTSDTQTTSQPSVVLPQDENEIDAAPDDHEFEITPEK